MGKRERMAERGNPGCRLVDLAPTAWIVGGKKGAHGRRKKEKEYQKRSASDDLADSCGSTDVWMGELLIIATFNRRAC